MDRISDLSDELLVKILTLVTTRVAVSTSILSKRWEYLWMWLPKLEFGRRRCPEPECERLRCFLDKNLPLHKAPVIESFRLEWSNPRFKAKNINLWVAIAESRCLRELEILYKSDPVKPITLLSSVFTCKSLVILKLADDILLDVPRMVSLPSLKTLKLQRVRYFNDDETLQRLLSNCPVLEDLVVDLRDRDTTRKLTVVVPSLQSLSIYIPYEHDIDGYVIETPNLKYFTLVDHCNNDHYCLIENMPNLMEAYVDVELPDINSIIGSITSVKRLSVCSQGMFEDGIVFNQLEHLELCICKEHFSSQLFQLLKASSNLQGVHLFLMEDHEPQHGMEDWNQWSTVPECLLSSLQTLNWSEYTAEPEERDIVVYILEHAAHLKTATIKSSEDEVPKFEMLKELALSSRASTTCKLMFECASGD